MAFSIRKMLSNITYFSKSGDAVNPDKVVGDDTRTEEDNLAAFNSTENIEFDRVEADSTSKYGSLKLPESVIKYAAKKVSLSDTDLLNININASSKQERRKYRKLKLDINKASHSLTDSVNFSEDSSVNVENTPKHKHLDCQSADLFKNFNFNQSFDLSDAESVASSYEDEIEILSDHSDTDLSEENNKVDIKMCHKVEEICEPLPSVTPESFADVEVDKNEDERVNLLLNYQMKIEKIDCLLKKLLNEFEFHIEVSKIFNCKSIVTALPSTDITNIPKTLGDISYMDNIQRGISPAGWNLVMEKEDSMMKAKLKNQLLTMRQSIDQFIDTNLNEKAPKLSQLRRSTTFNVHKGRKVHKQPHLSYKKKIKHYDFPDLRDAMLNLFSDEDESIDIENDHSKCLCQCHTDSTAKPEDLPDQSITSSIGNFTLDSTTLSAYSESLDHIVSYNSFNDTNSSLYNTLLQKAAIERITFYIQVHSVQLRCELTESNQIETKNVIVFHCPTCKITECEENGLLKHILSPNHCEKIHFIYKTAYVKKCISVGKEIQPSTVLNPMTMYRDDNKIVCFGDAMYACSLCFENLIVGESVLMAHCSDQEHVVRREMLADIFE